MRSIWSGAISFGLIYIPVKLYSASQSNELDFDLLRRDDHCRIGYSKICKESGEEVPNDEIVRGFEYRKGDYVIIEDEDFQRARSGRTKVIDIASFVNLDEIDTKFLEKPYFLEPDKGAKQVYGLLREALVRTNKVGLARFVMRNREHLAIIKPEDKVMVLNQMRYAAEIRTPDELDLPGKEGLADRELDMAVKLIDQLTEPWEPEQYRDTYIDTLREIIQQKAEGKELAPLQEEEVPTDVTDLFAKLRESLEQAQKDRGG
jgi:DNA end-binding protein Ku